MKNTIELVMKDTNCVITEVNATTFHIQLLDVTDIAEIADLQHFFQENYSCRIIHSDTLEVRFKSKWFKTIKITLPLDVYKRLVILRKSQHLTNSHIALNGLLCYFQEIELFNNMKIEDLERKEEK